MNDQTQERISRTVQLIGEAAARRLAASRVILFGVGGVGSYAAEALCRAGIGRIALVDGDTVAPSNLHRQLVALTSTIGQPKAEVMARRMASMKTSMKLAFMPGDRSVAELITDGCNMGVKSLSRYRNQYVNASPKAKEIADELIRIEEGLSHDMRSYL